MAEMNPLRRRMIEDMKIRNLSPVTQRCYVHAVSKFARYFNQPPDQLGLAEVRAYQIHVSGGCGIPDVRAARAGRTAVAKLDTPLAKWANTGTPPAAA